MLISPPHFACFMAVVSFIPSRGEALKDNDLVHEGLVNSEPFRQKAATTLLPEGFMFGPSFNDNKLEEESTTQDSSQVFDYIFVLYDDSSPDLHREELENVIADFGSNETKIMYQYKHVFQGFAVSKVSLELFEKIEAILGEEIEYITQNMEIMLHTSDAVDPNMREFAVHEHPTNWGLDRMDRFDMENWNHNSNVPPFDGRYHYSFSGLGVEVFVLDTGVRASHYDFAKSAPANTRVRCGFDAFSENGTNTSCHDKVGHGTFMAGTIGGSFYGVAKDVIITSVKVFNDVGRGTIASAIAGLDYVIQQKKASPTVPQVANLSFGLRQDEIIADALEDALEATLKAGVTIVTSSGNNGGSDCNVLPSNFPGVISVAASTYKDESAHYNDLGRCITLFAPGDRISGLWIRDDADSVTISGSSIASAHAAGAAALILEAFPYFTPEHVRLALLDISEEGAITDIPVVTRARNNFLNTAILTFVPEYNGLVSLTSG